ncbi:MAG: helix-turn-helix transcriptional regulator [Firmicutes bacterium]|nr:helix-turn-helix transcriptional regulator [Bacillota bacterium]MBR3212102.1 helix-turn-helix transcriptional regulator [Bacillota bacterium]
MRFDKIEFDVALVRAGVSRKQLAEYLDIDVSTLYRKIENDGAFTREEIVKIVELLKIDNPMKIFFAPRLAEKQVQEV